MSGLSIYLSFLNTIFQMTFCIVFYLLESLCTTNAHYNTRIQTLNTLKTDFSASYYLSDQTDKFTLPQKK